MKVDPAKESAMTQMLTTQYHEFFSRFSVDLSLYKFDIVILKDIARRYLRDVERLHAFHNIQYIDCHKIAGYLTYWIAKLKPISTTDNKVYLLNCEPPLYINELFAVYVAIGRIYHHLKTINSDKKIIIDNNFLKSFLYTLKYRNTTGDNLAMLYYYIEAK